MNLTFKAPAQALRHLSTFWGQYFKEIPTCTNPGCERVAIEVDPYFPYLDDFNRCEAHRTLWMGKDVVGSLS